MKYAICNQHMKNVPRRQSFIYRQFDNRPMIDCNFRAFLEISYFCLTARTEVGVSNGSISAAMAIKRAACQFKRVTLPWSISTFGYVKSAKTRIVTYLYSICYVCRRKLVGFIRFIVFLRRFYQYLKLKLHLP